MCTSRPKEPVAEVSETPDEPAQTPLAPEPETAPGGFAATSPEEVPASSSAAAEEQAESSPVPDPSSDELAASAAEPVDISPPSEAGSSLQDQIDALAREEVVTPTPEATAPEAPAAEPLTEPRAGAGARAARS